MRLLARSWIIFFLFANSAQRLAAEDYWGAFPYNPSFLASVLEVHLYSATAVTGTVSILSLGINNTFTVPAGGKLQINLSNAVMMPGSPTEVVRDLGVHISSTGPLVAAISPFDSAIDDAISLRELASLGTEYRVLSAYGPGGAFQVIATEDGTMVEIVPQSALVGHAAGVTYTVSLQKGQVYQYIESVFPLLRDISGAHIRSNKPVAVQSGSFYQGIPFGVYSNDIIWDSLAPVSAWDRRYVLLPYAWGSPYYVYKVVAHQDGTALSINGAPVGTLNAGASYGTASAQVLDIEASSPIQVGQFIASHTYGTTTNKLGDPALAILTGVHQGVTVTVLGTKNSYYSSSNYQGLHAVFPTGAILLFDGLPVPPEGLVAAGDYAYARVTISAGAHQVSCPEGVALQVYGMRNVVSYAYGVPGLLAAPPTLAPTSTSTPTPTPTPSASPTLTASSTESPTMTRTVTLTETPSPSATDQGTAPPSATYTLTLTVTLTATPSLTSTPPPTPVPPLALVLYEPNPNPARGEAYLPYSITCDAFVTLKAYTVAGELVRSWEDGFKPMGVHESRWDLRNSSGAAVATGVFIYSVEAKSPIGEVALRFKKMAVLRP